MKLIVTPTSDGTLECTPEGATGSPVVGRGMSVTEAVGDWCIQSGAQEIVCVPASLLDYYRLVLMPIARRD
jgi:hypothetical protein